MASRTSPQSVYLKGSVNDDLNGGLGKFLPSLYTSIYGSSAPPSRASTATGITRRGLWTGTVIIDPATTSIVPSSSNSGCVSWGAMILSTTVQDTDHDGLLDVWEGPNQGYNDAVSGQFVALPGANPAIQVSICRS